MSDPNGQISQIESLENGKGLQYLLNEAYRILANPFLLFNMDYMLLACTENIVTDDQLWNEIVGTGVHSDESINFFKDEDFIDIVASTNTIALLTSDKLKYDRLYGRIFNSDNSTVADLVMVACNKPIEEDDPIIFEAFCGKLSKEINTSEFYQQYGVVYHETLIRQLLDRDFDDKVIYSDHIANLYEGLKTNLFVAVADVSKCNSANSGLEGFRDLLKKTQAEFKYAVYSGYVVIIVSTDDMALNINRDLNELVRLFEHNNVYAGISGRFENLFDLRKHYGEAVNALIHGLKTEDHRRIFPYDDNDDDKDN